MLLSRKITAAFAAIFIIGVLVGMLIAWDLADTKLSDFMKKTGDPTSMVARIDQKYSKDYQLTPDEQSRIHPLTKEMAQHLYQVRQQFGMDILATLDDYHQKIGEQMTPAQREAYDKANADRKKRMSAMLLLDQNPSDQGQK